MICPVCQSEFREGFTRCEECNVDLVEELSETSPSAARRREGKPLIDTVPLVNYCGFLDLGEARQARDQLRGEGIRSEILIREEPGSDLSEAVSEEFWIRVSPRDFQAAASILGYDVAGGGEETISCSSCGRPVAAEETFCPHCGARFEEGG